jgi:hypothetical protein
VTLLTTPLHDDEVCACGSKYRAQSAVGSTDHKATFESDIRCDIESANRLMVCACYSCDGEQRRGRRPLELCDSPRIDRQCRSSDVLRLVGREKQHGIADRPRLDYRYRQHMEVADHRGRVVHGGLG